ncbi:neuraminidase [Paraflavitalea soli]|uniref:Neuraminidase n=1 Tax=Paraflavitalea soli TaxID=2315862 RepID=A0A3B7MWQ6_9BACT|nr:BNR repeat-containing protein [Paraflavitalea soli]AXY77893.1 neuraminidase [Paraflavitalea soli]
MGNFPGRVVRILLIILLPVGIVQAQTVPGVKHSTIADGWANNSINVVVFRKNSLVTHDGWQYTAFYDQDRYVVLGKRKQGAAQWQLKRTPYQGNTADAHNTISLMVDGDGYLHLSWDHHNNALRYCRSSSPGSLELTDKMPMTGQLEERVSYPEFYKLPNGNLLFLYRNGQSGQGNLVINQYDRHTKKWSSLHSNLIDGEGQRNAYWQACVDTKGTLHLSWVWRETPDVASNHDLAYARSKDGGLTWEKSTGEKYLLPITAATAEYACRIPQKSELINQTSLYADGKGMPYIATYWREAGSAVPQYHVVYANGKQWQVQDLGFRTTPFSLSGGGTKRIPISRPQVMVWRTGRRITAALVFRDAERNDKVSVAIKNDITKGAWQVTDLTTESVGSWEPTYDTEWWKQKGILQLFVQKVEQVDGEGKANIPPQPIQVLEWKPSPTFDDNKKR